MSDPAVDRRVWSYPAYAALLGSIAVGLLAPGLLRGTGGLVPLLVSLVVFGMAHGAVDHHVARRLDRPQRTWLFFVLYLAAALAVGSLWLLAPSAGLVAFLAVSVVHWGQGELWFAVATGRPPPTSRLRLVAFGLPRGALPILLPFLAHPEEATDVASSILRLFDGSAAVGVPSGAVRIVGLGLLGLAMLVALVCASRDGAPVAREAGELGLLAATFLLVPPTFAVGVYFLTWHAPRHVVRLLAADPAQRALLVARRPGRAVAAFHREAAPLSVVALLGCALLAVAIRTDVGGEETVAVSLAVIAGLTWPHAAVVARMDHVQGVLPTAGRVR